eukprot:575478-Alexandrium_andersonii.AAC.1
MIDPGTSLRVAGIMPGIVPSIVLSIVPSRAQPGAAGLRHARANHEGHRAEKQPIALSAMQ